MPILISPAYFGTISYWSFMLAHQTKHDCVIEIYDHFEKQSIRNTTEILAANGIQKLSVPIAGSKNKVLTKDILIDTKTNWQAHHIRAIESAYRSAPYFEYYWDYIKDAILLKSDSLYLYDYHTFLTINKLLKAKIQTSFSTQYDATIPTDLTIRTKKALKSIETTFLPIHSYTQVFSYKTAFQPNLSILDLLFNVGSDSHHYLIDRNR